jgi:WD40 repeat protein
MDNAACATFFLFGWGYDDKTARIWQAYTPMKTVGELTGHEGPVISAAFSPDGKHIITVSADQTARLWEIFSSTQEFLASGPSHAWCIDMEKWPYLTPAWKAWLADTRAGNFPHLPAE